MFTTQLFAFIQSRTFGIPRCASLWHSRYANAGNAETSAVAAMNGKAAIPGASRGMGDR